MIAKNKKLNSPAEKTIVMDKSSYLFKFEYNEKLY